MREQDPHPSGTEEALATMRCLLRERLEVIADHAWRDRDPAGHLARLRWVSERLQELHRETRAALPARLNHFLDNASLQKALAFLEEGRG